MRLISSGNPNTNIVVMDEAGQAGDHPEGAINPFTVTFRNGPVNDFGINGCHQEDLLVIVEAMHWLNHRTLERMKRGVEGTNKK